MLTTSPLARRKCSQAWFYSNEKSSDTIPHKIPGLCRFLDILQRVPCFSFQKKIQQSGTYPMHLWESQLLSSLMNKRFEVNKSSKEDIAYQYTKCTNVLYIFPITLEKTNQSIFNSISFHQRCKQFRLVFNVQQLHVHVRDGRGFFHFICTPNEKFGFASVSVLCSACYTIQMVALI